MLPGGKKSPPELTTTKETTTMIKHMTVITNRKGTIYHVFHIKDYLLGTCTRRTYSHRDNLPKSVLAVLLGETPADYDVTYVNDQDPSYGVNKIEHYIVPVKQYTVDYIVPSAMGNWSGRRRYTCKDEADFRRCRQLHFEGKVKILAVNGKERA